MTNPLQTDVLIVGAGPTGLALGAELRRIGGSCSIVDKLLEGLNTSRAAAIHARSLEVLQPLGVTERLLEIGLKIPKFEIRDRDRTLLTIDFSHLHTEYPFVLNCPQNRTEAVLLQRLRELGGEVQRPTEVTDLKVQVDTVAIDAQVNGQAQSIDAQWLVGCDGMHSTVRELAGIPFEGETYVQNFILGDVHMEWPLSRDESTAFFAPAGLLAVFPLPDEHFRIIAVVDEAPPQPSLTFLQALLDERGPTVNPGKIQDVVWSSRFRVHHRMAKFVRQGRILLCGDAAHVHSPAGGQGMNTGIQDAVSLAGPLLTAVRNGITEELDAWAKRRHEIAKEVIANTDRLTRIGTVSSPSGQALRNMAMRFLGHIPAVRTAAAESMSELDNR